MKPTIKLVIVGKSLQEIIYTTAFDANINIQWGAGAGEIFKASTGRRKISQTFYNTCAQFSLKSPNNSK